jgi:hypothetical protein
LIAVSAAPRALAAQVVEPGMLPPPSPRWARSSCSLRRQVTPAETRPAPIARTSSIVPILKDLEVVIGSCAWLDRTCGELEFAAAGEGEEHPVVPIVVFEAAG